MESKVFLSSTMESDWVFIFPEDAEVSSESNLNNGKRGSDDEADDDRRQSKSLKLMGLSIHGNNSTEAEQQQEQQDESDSNNDSDGTSLIINKLDRDNVINCFLRCSISDYRSIASVNKSFRSLVKSGELYRVRRQNHIVESWVYFSCQILEWVAFNPVAIKWMKLPKMPSNSADPFNTFGQSDKESLAVGTDLLVLGVENYSSHVIYRYSLLTNSWSSGMKMNTPRCLFGSASLGEIAIFAGGSEPGGIISDVAEMYNSELQIWTTLPKMNKPRKMSSGVFMDGKFYVIGGLTTGSKLLTCGEEFDLVTKKWTVIPDMSPPRSQAMGADSDAPPLVAVVNNQLYAADHADMELKKYDKENKIWFTLGRLPERADSVKGWGLAFRACGDRLIVIGGPKCSGGGSIELNSWIPDQNPPVWTLLDKRASPTFVYNCAVMGC